FLMCVVTPGDVITQGPGRVTSHADQATTARIDKRRCERPSRFDPFGLFSSSGGPERSPDRRGAPCAASPGGNCGGEGGKVRIMAAGTTGHKPWHPRRLLIGALGILLLAAVLWFGIPWIRFTLATESTDDAFVNGHVTFVAARVSGQVSRVLVDDNNRVHKGD